VIGALLSRVAWKVMLSGKLSVGWSFVTPAVGAADAEPGDTNVRVTSSKLKVRQRSEVLRRMKSSIGLETNRVYHSHKGPFNIVNIPSLTH
jgi:hypothetical protein